MSRATRRTVKVTVQLVVLKSKSECNGEQKGDGKRHLKVRVVFWS